MYWSRKRGVEEVWGCMFAKYLYFYIHVFVSLCNCIWYCRWKRENKRCGCVFVFATYWVKHQTLSFHQRESNTICFLGLFYFFLSRFVSWLIYSKYLTQVATIIKSHTLLLLYYSWFFCICSLQTQVMSNTIFFSVSRFVRVSLVCLCPNLEMIKYSFFC